MGRGGTAVGDGDGTSPGVAPTGEREAAETGFARPTSYSGRLDLAGHYSRACCGSDVGGRLQNIAHHAVYGIRTTPCLDRGSDADTTTRGEIFKHTSISKYIMQRYKKKVQKPNET